jgi:hypothetical protein
LVIPVRCFALQCLAAFGVLVAPAILDVGSRACAAYVAAGTDVASVGMSSADVNDGPAPVPPQLEKNRDGLPNPAGHLQRGGGMAPPSSNSSSGNSPVVADLSDSQLPTCSAAAYYREPPTSIDLSAFIDSILDPPRQA